ncbi:MAG: hypothetical protein WBG73_12435 [Coleofasciculaceae cyanobacterium]
MNYKKMMPLVLLALQASPALASNAVTSHKLATVSSVIQNQLSPPATQNNVSTTQITDAISGSDARKSAKNTEALPLKPGMRYKQARQLLLRQGWRPNLQNDPPNLNSLTIRKLYDLGYVEIEDCSGTGQGFCRFNLINDNGDQLFVVTTPGGNPNPDPFVSKWWIEKKSASFNQITEGRYWLGATDQALEVKGKQYRYDSEGGAQQWQPISQLKYIKNGVVFDGKTYWCLSTLAPQNGVAACSAKGWATQAKLPFVGTRRFNFLGGSGTGQSITIEADGSTVVQLHGTMNSSVLYKGQFANPITLNDGSGLLLRGNKVHQVSSDGLIVKSCNGKETCEAELY